jgi:excisionase family DNA binding protein
MDTIKHTIRIRSKNGDNSPGTAPGQARHSSSGTVAAKARDLLTVSQSADYLQLSASSIRSYIRQGKLKAFRIAGLRKVLIARTELLALLEPAQARKACSVQTSA